MPLPFCRAFSSFLAPLIAASAAAQSGQLVQLPVPGGQAAEATHISDDGRTVLMIPVPTTGTPYRWTQSGGTQSLPPVGVNGWSGMAMSSDGNVVVGYHRPTNSQDRLPVRWSSSAGASIFLSTTTPCEADEVSADGSVVLARGVALQPLVRRWEAPTGLQDILVTGYLNSYASVYRDMSRDGDVIIGTYVAGTYVRGLPFRWTAATGSVLIGYPPSGQLPAGWNFVDTLLRGSSEAGDAFIVDCVARNAANNERWYPFIWTTNHGYRQLAPIPSSSTWTVRAISGDGSTVILNENYSGGSRYFLIETASLQVTHEIPSFLMRALSRDGSVIVGSMSSQPVAWIRGFGPQYWGVPTVLQGALSAVSPDGRFAVGTTSVPIRVSIKSCTPASYCVGKITSSMSIPSIGAAGVPSASTGGFSLTLSGAVPLKAALVFGGSQPASKPFQGGTLCVASPIQRSQTTSTNATGFAQHFLPITPVMVGSTRFYQWWFRDPQDPFGSGLSNALEVSFCD